MPKPTLKVLESVMNCLSSIAVQESDADQQSCITWVPLKAAFGSLNVDASTLKKVVQAKLPFKVWQLCSKLVQSGMPHKAAIAHETAFEMARMTISRDLKREHLADRNTAAIRANLRGLPQQLEQSGWLEQLPVLMTAIAKKLQREAAAAAAAAGQEGYAAAAAAPRAGIGGSRDSSAAPAWEPAGPPGDLAWHTLQGFLDVQVLLPDYITSTAAGRECLLAAAHLAVASKQYLSTCSSALQHQMPHERLMMLSVMASEAACGCNAAVKHAYDRSNESPSCSSTYREMAKQLSQDARYVECTAFSVARWMLVPLVRKYQKRHKQVPQGLSSISSHSSNSSSSSSGSVQPGASAGRSLEGQPQWAPYALVDKVPLPVADLLQALGCSREVGLWAAWEHWREVPAGTSSGDSDKLIQGLVQFYAEPFVGMLSQLGLSLLEGEQQQQPQEQQQLERLLQLRLRLSVAYLDWAAGLKGTSFWGVETSYFAFQAAFLSLTWCSYQTESSSGGLSVGVLPAALQQAVPQDIARALRQYAARILPQWTQAMRAQWESGITSSSGGGGSSSSSGGGGGSITAAKVVESGGNLLTALAKQYTLPAAGTAAAAHAASTAVDAASGVHAAQQQQQQQQQQQRSVSVDYPGADTWADVSKLCSLLQDLARSQIQASRQPAQQVLQQSSSSYSTRPVVMLRQILRSFSDDNDNSTDYVKCILVQGVLDSPAALELFGLLCSLLKTGNWGAKEGMFPGMADVAETSNSAATNAANFMLYKATPGVQHAVQHPSSGPAAAAGGAGGGGDSGSTAASALLPWLALYGRSCLQCDALTAHMTVSERLSAVREIVIGLTQVQRWLSDAAVSEGMARMGYDVTSLLQLVQQAAAAAALLQSSGTATAVLDDLTQQLQALGQGLNNFAIPHACNNPWCSNVSGRSEAVLVGGRSCICAGCQKARYCSKACQKQHWKQHKPVCKALAAAAAAAV